MFNCGIPNLLHATVKENKENKSIQIFIQDKVRIIIFESVITFFLN